MIDFGVYSWGLFFDRFCVVVFGMDQICVHKTVVRRRHLDQVVRRNKIIFVYVLNKQVNNQTNKQTKAIHEQCQHFRLDSIIAHLSCL